MGPGELPGVKRQGVALTTHPHLAPRLKKEKTASMVYWSEFLATDTEVPGSIPGAIRFSE